MSKTIRLAKELELPLDCVTQKLAMLGRSGSGKTFAAKRLVEQMLRASVQVVVLDPIGIWFGLRLGSKGFDIPVLGGLYGDIPLEPTAGAVVADLIIDRGTSMVVDLSQMRDGERTRFAAAFGERLFQRKKAKPSAMHLVLEECQDFVPQNPQHGEEMMLHEFQRIAKQGRSFGIGLTLISQRPQEVSKKALNQTECIFAFQMTGPQERKALEYWLSDKGFDGKLSDILPRLEIGAPHVWSPSWLKISKIVHILPIDSLDTSATPKVGQKAFAREKLGPIDLAELQKAMAATIEKAKADDPKALRARIADLEKRLAKPGVAVAPEWIEVPVFDSEFFGHAFEDFVAALARAKSAVNLAEEEARRRWIQYRDVCRSTASASKKGVAPQIKASNGARLVIEMASTRAPAEKGAVGGSPGNRSLSKMERLILTAAAQAHPEELPLKRLAAIVGVHERNGNFRNNLGALRSRGCMEETGITEQGFQELGDYDELPTGSALLDWWCGNKLPKMAVLIARAMQQREFGRVDELAALLGIHERNGNFRNNLGKLRSLGIVGGLSLEPAFRDG